MKKILLSIVVIGAFVPLVTFAAWWNPFTWFKKESKPADTQVTISQNQNNSFQVLTSENNVNKIDSIKTNSTTDPIKESIKPALSTYKPSPTQHGTIDRNQELLKATRIKDDVLESEYKKLTYEKIVTEMYRQEVNYLVDVYNSLLSDGTEMGEKVRNVTDLRHKRIEKIYESWLEIIRWREKRISFFESQGSDYYLKYDFSEIITEELIAKRKEVKDKVAAQEKSIANYKNLIAQYEEFNATSQKKSVQYFTTYKGSPAVVTQEYIGPNPYRGRSLEGINCDNAWAEQRVLEGCDEYYKRSGLLP